VLHTYGTYVIFPITYYKYSTRMLFCRMLTIRWPHYTTKTNCVSYLTTEVYKRSALNASLILANANNEWTSRGLVHGQFLLHKKMSLINSTKCNCICTICIRYFFPQCTYSMRMLFRKGTYGSTLVNKWCHLVMLLCCCCWTGGQQWYHWAKHNQCFWKPS